MLDIRHFVPGISPDITVYTGRSGGKPTRGKKEDKARSERNDPRDSVLTVSGATMPLTSRQSGSSSSNTYRTGDYNRSRSAGAPDTGRSLRSSGPPPGFPALRRGLSALNTSITQSSIHKPKPPSAPRPGGHLTYAAWDEMQGVWREHDCRMDESMGTSMGNEPSPVISPRNPSTHGHFSSSQSDESDAYKFAESIGNADSSSTSTYNPEYYTDQRHTGDDTEVEFKVECSRYIKFDSLKRHMKLELEKIYLSSTATFTKYAREDFRITFSSLSDEVEEFLSKSVFKYRDSKIILMRVRSTDELNQSVAVDDGELTSGRSLKESRHPSGQNCLVTPTSQCGDASWQPVQHNPLEEPHKSDKSKTTWYEGLDENPNGETKTNTESNSNVNDDNDNRKAHVHQASGRSLKESQHLSDQKRLVTPTSQGGDPSGTPVQHNPPVEPHKFDKSKTTRHAQIDKNPRGETKANTESNLNVNVDDDNDNQEAHVHQGVHKNPNSVTNIPSEDASLLLNVLRTNKMSSQDIINNEEGSLGRSRLERCNSSPASPENHAVNRRFEDNPIHHRRGSCGTTGSSTTDREDNRNNSGDFYNESNNDSECSLDDRGHHITVEKNVSTDSETVEYNDDTTQPDQQAPESVTIEAGDYTDDEDDANNKSTLTGFLKQPGVTHASPHTGGERFQQAAEERTDQSERTSENVHVPRDLVHEDPAIRSAQEAVKLDDNALQQMKVQPGKSPAISADSHNEHNIVISDFAQSYLEGEFQTRKAKKLSQQVSENVNRTVPALGKDGKMRDQAEASLLPENYKKEGYSDHSERVLPSLVVDVIQNDDEHQNAASGLQPTPAAISKAATSRSSSTDPEALSEELLNVEIPLERNILLNDLVLCIVNSDIVLGGYARWIGRPPTEQVKYMIAIELNTLPADQDLIECTEGTWQFGSLRYRLCDSAKKNIIVREFDEDVTLSPGINSHQLSVRRHIKRANSYGRDFDCIYYNGFEGIYYKEHKPQMMPHINTEHFEVNSMVQLIGISQISTSPNGELKWIGHIDATESFYGIMEVSDPDDCGDRVLTDGIYIYPESDDTRVWLAVSDKHNLLFRPIERFIIIEPASADEADQVREQISYTEPQPIGCIGDTSKPNQEKPEPMDIDRDSELSRNNLNRYNDGSSNDENDTNKKSSITAIQEHPILTQVLPNAGGQFQQATEDRTTQSERTTGEINVHRDIGHEAQALRSLQEVNNLDSNRSQQINVHPKQSLAILDDTHDDKNISKTDYVQTGMEEGFQTGAAKESSRNIPENVNLPVPMKSLHGKDNERSDRTEASWSASNFPKEDFSDHSRSLLSSVVDQTQNEVFGGKLLEGSGDDDELTRRRKELSGDDFSKHGKQKNKKAFVNKTDDTSKIVAASKPKQPPTHQQHQQAASNVQTAPAVIPKAKTKDSLKSNPVPSTEKLLDVEIPLEKRILVDDLVTCRVISGIQVDGYARWIGRSPVKKTKYFIAIELTTLPKGKDLSACTFGTWQIGSATYRLCNSAKKNVLVREFDSGVWRNHRTQNPQRPIWWHLDEARFDRVQRYSNHVYYNGTENIYYKEYEPQMMPHIDAEGYEVDSLVQLGATQDMGTLGTLKWTGLLDETDPFYGIVELLDPDECDRTLTDGIYMYSENKGSPKVWLAVSDKHNLLLRPIKQFNVIEMAPVKPSSLGVQDLHMEEEYYSAESFPTEQQKGQEQRLGVEVPLDMDILLEDRVAFQYYELGYNTYCRGIAKWIGRSPMNKSQFMIAIALINELDITRARKCTDGLWTFGNTTYRLCESAMSNIIVRKFDQVFRDTDVPGHNQLMRGLINQAKLYKPYNDRIRYNGSEGFYFEDTNPTMMPRVESFNLETGTVMQLGEEIGELKWTGTIEHYPGIEKSYGVLEMFEPEESRFTLTDGIYINDGGTRVWLYISDKPNLIIREIELFQKPFGQSPVKHPDKHFTQEVISIDGYIPPQPFVRTHYLGRDNGVQGDHNSCYMDATLYCLFSFSTAFDDMLLRKRKDDDITDFERIQRILREKIVNPMRLNGITRAPGVHEFREMLDGLGKVHGLQSEEKDPEELINLLLRNVFNVPYYLELSNSQSCHTFHLLADADSAIKFPSIQKLVEYTCNQDKLQFVKMPPCLILQVPRFGKEFKMYEYIYPCDTLDLTDLLQKGGSRTCYVCGEAAEIECENCFKESKDLAKGTFCRECSETKIHKQSRAEKRNHKRLTIKDAVKPATSFDVGRSVLKLSAVLCIERSHYVSYVRTSEDGTWLFLDSMSDRVAEQNIPEVKELPDLDLSRDWYVRGEWQKGDKYKDVKNLHHLTRRLFKDVYACIYVNPEASHYGLQL